jgi:hypothetical protein
MRVELYVVTTEIAKNSKDCQKCTLNAHCEQCLKEEDERKQQLEQLKVELCKKFGGLTVIDNCEGYWTDNGQLIKDDVQIWRILSTDVITPKDIMPYAERLKSVCKQKVQLFTVADMPYYV